MLGLGLIVWNWKRLSLLLLCLFVNCTSKATKAQAQTSLFRCGSNGTCNSLIDYVSPNSTTLSAVQRLFGVKNLRSLLGANGLRLSTPSNQTLAANQTVKIPFPCLCSNGTGISNKRPVYTVVPGDDLYHIAAQVFSGLVTYTQIQRVNNISHANLIFAGQRLWIPLPCSCDDVDGRPVVHYGYVVPAGSTVGGIAREYNITQDTLLRLNGLRNPNDLLAGAVFDIPLRACTSMVGNNSMDYPLLVPNGTYVFTATNCVRCNCDATNNWILQCEPSQIKSSLWKSCPSMQCQGADNLYIGNTTSSTCNRTTCDYAGYTTTNQTIFTTPVLESACPVSANNASKFSLQGWSWNFLPISIHMVLLSFRFHH